MNTITTPTTRNRRPRIAKGTLVATTNQARLACMKLYTTFYHFRPISYTLVRRVIIDNPILN